MSAAPMMKVTAEDVTAMIGGKPMYFVHCHDCSICGYRCGYEIDGVYIVFDGGCYCTDRYNVIGRTVQDLADWINMQSSAENAGYIIGQITGVKP